MKAYAQTFPSTIPGSSDQVESVGFYPQDSLPDIANKGTHTVDGQAGFSVGGAGTERQDIINSNQRWPAHRGQRRRRQL